jgi:uncharacterized protein (TIGR00369 family)
MGAGQGMSETNIEGFGLEAAQALLKTDIFPAWIQDLQLGVEKLHPAADPDGIGAVLRMKFSERLCRDGGMICGQALMSLADTAMIFAVSAASGGYRPMSTVDLTTHFMRPAVNSDVLADARIVRMGKSMAFGQVMLTGVFDPKPLAMVSSAYALM